MMTRSKSDSRFASGDALINQIRDDQLERLRRVGDLWESQLADWEDLAKAEESVRREYHGRYLFELLQNASDAIVDWRAGGKTSPQDQCFVRIELTGSSLLVANFGMPFGEDNIRALCRLHVTTKSASKQIGHKGIGFKSTLETTETPEVYSDRYAFGFNRQEFAAKVRKITGDHSLEETSLPVLRAPFIRRLSWLSPDEQERIDALFDQGYVTVIRLPLESGDTLARVEKHMRAELRPELLLFLDAIDQLEICYPSGEDVAYWCRRENCDLRQGHHESLVWSDEGGDSHIESRWLALSPRELPIDDQSLVADLGEAWEEVRAVRCMVAFPLTKDGKLRSDLGSQKLRVYFPTEEFCGLRFLVNADFYIESARKDIRRNPLNDWLAQELALFTASTGVDALRSRFPHDPGIVDVLAPVQCPERDFGRYFFEQYLLALSSSQFVPLEGGQYKIPVEVRFPPEGPDTRQFRGFFPPSRLRGQARWAFPMLEVEECELRREADGHPFLLSEELGTARVELSEIVAVLSDGPPIPFAQCGEFLRFLAHWWDELGYHDRRGLQEALSKCAIVPTQSGWKCPSEDLIFQANLREERDIGVPEGFEFELVPLEAYGEERSYQGTPARFLEVLGVSPYQAREILRRAILPVLRSPERFQTLIEHYPNAIFDAYAFLKSYYERERSATEIQSDLPRIPVPAYSPTNPSECVWRPAGETYFSAYWTGDDDLEAIYGQFGDVCFLGQVRELAGLDDPEQKQTWYGFFSWLGVSHKPRVLEQGGTHSWDEVVEQHPFHERRLWADYLGRFEGAFDCDNPQKHHGRSRLMAATWALDHFEDLGLVGDVRLLGRLFRLLGRYWDEYRRYLSTSLSCKHTTTGCDDADIPSYLAYCLQEVAWMPATRWEQLVPRPFCARDIWNLGDDARPEVRRMLPSLPEEFRKDAYRAIRADLLRTDVAFEDYLGLLQRLPELCPLEPEGFDDENLKRWQDAARAVFNWLGQALQNSLVRMGEANWPQRPEHFQVLVYRGETPCYVDVGTPELVYPDDPFLARGWADDLFYLKIDESWGSLRDWLQVARLSERVIPEVRPSEESRERMTVVRERYRDTLPYFLALVFEQQNSRFKRVLSRLNRLDMHVVGKLEVLQRISLLDVPPKRSSERVYLESRDDPNPRGGRAIRAGDLYIVQDEMDNPDILGSHIANYIEIPGLSDAFVLLYGRDKHEERMRFLDSRGVIEDVVRHVAQRLDVDIDEYSLSSEYDDLAQVFHDQECALATLPSVDTAPTAPPPQPHQPPKTETGDMPSKKQPELPPLDKSGNIGVETYSKPETPPLTPDETDKGKRHATGGGHGFRFLSEEERTMLGERGEDWAYAAERQRLKILGLDPDALEREGRQEWVAHRDRFANHDIRSVDMVNGRSTEIYIEVKSTTGQDRTVEWPIGEFRLALSAGDRYWLYWVAHVDRERPDQPVRYQNPVRLWQEGYIQLGFRQLAIQLPEETEDE
jgi:hypothetical protein